MDYEKKYKNALEWARQVMNGETGFIRKEVEDVFPELAESEDERIRKELIDYHRSMAAQADDYVHEAWIAWLERQGEKDKLIKELGEYKVKYTQEVLENHLKTMNKDDERLRKTTIAFLKDFADKGYENAVECIDWLEKQKPINITIEDERMVDNLIRIFEVNYPNEYYKALRKDMSEELIPVIYSIDIIDWLKSLKDRIE